MSIKEAAVYLGKTEWAVRYLVRIRAIPLVRLTKKRLSVDKIALDEWIEKNKIRPIEEEQDL